MLSPFCSPFVYIGTKPYGVSAGVSSSFDTQVWGDRVFAAVMFALACPRVAPRQQGYIGRVSISLSGPPLDG